MTLEDDLGFSFPCNNCEWNKPLLGDPCCTNPFPNGVLDCPKIEDPEKIKKMNEFKEKRNRNNIPKLDGIGEFVINTLRNIYDDN